MRKFLFFTSVLLIFTLAVKSQNTLAHVTKRQTLGTTGHAASNGICDTLNLFSVNNAKAYIWVAQNRGSCFGVSKFIPATKINEDANRFDVSGSQYQYVKGGMVFFAFANSNVPGNMNKPVRFKLYNEVTNGTPGITAVDSVDILLSVIHSNVLNGLPTYFLFTNPVTIPANGKFYIAVDHSQFSWDNSRNIHDSIVIVTTDSVAGSNTAYQHGIDSLSGATPWLPASFVWKDPATNRALNVQLYIFPIVSQFADTRTCAQVLPVSIFNFGGVVKNDQTYLNWSTASETNNKGFYVERSKDGRNFSSLGFVNGAGNSSVITNYAYTDVSLKDINSSVTYYRLKQVDLDGKFSYSNVLSLNLKPAGLWKLYPNPVKAIATVELHLDAASKVNVKLLSQDGKVLVNADKGLLAEGTQQIFIDTRSIAKGSYILRLTINDKKYTQILVKE